MYNTTDKSYLQARAIKKGEHKLTPEHQNLVNWVGATFGVSVLDFTCDTKETSAGYRQQVVLIIVETIADCTRIENPSNEMMIAQKFLHYFKTADAETKKSDPLKRDIFAIDGNQFPEIIVGFRPLEEIELKSALQNSTKDQAQALEKWKEIIWNKGGNTGHTIIFYYTDTQLRENQTNGTSAAIINDLLQAVKKYDEFNYFGAHSMSVAFDSKETFDRDYQGNWHNYYQ